MTCHLCCPYSTFSIGAHRLNAALQLKTHQNLRHLLEIKVQNRLKLTKIK